MGSAWSYKAGFTSLDELQTGLVILEVMNNAFSPGLHLVLSMVLVVCVVFPRNLVWFLCDLIHAVFIMVRGTTE